MKNFCLFVVLVLIYGCGTPQPRKPVEVRSGSFMKESVERNIALLASEEQRILEIIKKDSLREYQASASGSWFYYDNKVEENGDLPEPNDLVTFSYNLRNLDNDTIYSHDDIGVLRYKVDKQELFPGLRNSVKLLKEGETATFLFPSSLAYGYHGDNQRIGTNIPLKATITLLKIEKQKDSILK